MNDSTFDREDRLNSFPLLRRSSQIQISSFLMFPSARLQNELLPYEHPSKWGLFSFINACFRPFGPLPGRNAAFAPCLRAVVLLAFRVRVYMAPLSYRMPYRPFVLYGRFSVFLPYFALIIFTRYHSMGANIRASSSGVLTLLAAAEQ